MAIGTDLVDTYVEPFCIDAGTDPAAVAALTEIARGQDVPRYSAQAFELAADGSLATDLSPYLRKPEDDADELDYDSTASVPESAKFSLSTDLDLTWGSSAVALYQLIQSAEYNDFAGYRTDAWLRFGLGHFVVTSPGFEDLDINDVRSITGYGKNYLLQSSPSDTFSFDAGTTYLAAVTALFVAAGQLVDGELLSTVCDYPGTWPAKLLKTPHNYPLGDDTFLTIINDLLASSGCRGIYTRVTGRWVIAYIPKPARQALRWRWAASDDDSLTDDDLDIKVVLFKQNRYSGDVWNAPNQWNFVQSGLDFPPGFDGATDGSSGLYQVNNTTAPPTDQVSVGRIVAVTVALDASGQDDLVAQGDKLVTEALSQTEKITLTTDPWPVGRHFDVFQVTHEAFPFGSLRRVQAQSWKLPLWGQAMTWETNAVAQL